MNVTDIKHGYVYHIKDTYFDMVKDDKLLRNKESGTYRPTYYCHKDEKSGLLWVIPMNRRAAKYEGFMQKDIDRYGKCLKIVIGEYTGTKAAFLLQNMFPILPKYIDHIHKVKQVSIAVSFRLQTKLSRSFRELMHLHRRGIKIVFTDITRLEKLMLEDAAAETETK